MIRLCKIILIDMSVETMNDLIAILGDVDTPVKAGMNQDDIGRTTNPAANLRLAVQQQRHPRPSRAAQSQQEEGEENIIMAKAKKKGHKKEGKFALIKAMVSGGKHTRSQIIAAAQAAFPHWPAKLVECGVFASRSQLRKKDPKADWLPEPATEAAPPPPVAATAPTAVEAAAATEEKPHITQPTVAKAA